MPQKTLVFDLDGTLLDSADVWYKIDVEFLKKRGFDLPGDYALAVSSMHLGEAAVYTIKRFGLNESPEDIATEWRQMAYHAYAERIAMKNGAKAFLQRAAEAGYRMAVATALDRQLAEASLRHHGVRDLFCEVVCAAEVGQGKSSPAIFRAVADLLCVSPHDCVVFEDTLSGVTSAKAAGMTVFAMEDAGSAADRAKIQTAADGYFTDFSAVPFVF